MDLSDLEMMKCRVAVRLTVSDCGSIRFSDVVDWLADEFDTQTVRTALWGMIANEELSIDRNNTVRFNRK